MTAIVTFSDVSGPLHGTALSLLQSSKLEINPTSDQPRIIYFQLNTQPRVQLTSNVPVLSSISRPEGKFSRLSDSLEAHQAILTASEPVNVLRYKLFSGERNRSSR